MSRPLRIEFDGAWYHVMNRGIARQNIFNNDVQRRFFIRLLEEASRYFGVEIHVFCLMGNHYHLLLHTPKAGLAKFMRHINGIYTQFFNKFEKRDGPLFKGRYKAILIEDDIYLLNVSRYIHLNPVEAGIIKQPEDYDFSSCRFYILNVQPPKWLHTEIVLSLSGNINQKDLYRQYINEGLDFEIEEFYKMKNQPTILGSEIFINQHLSALSKNKIKHSQPDFNRSYKVPSIEEIINACAVYFNTPIAEITHYRRGKQNLFRHLSMYLCRILSQTETGNIAPYFNCASKNGISNAIRRIKNKLTKDTDLVNKLFVLEESIIKKGVKD